MVQIFMDELASNRVPGVLNVALLERDSET